VLIIIVVVIVIQTSERCAKCLQSELEAAAVGRQAEMVKYGWKR